MCIISLLYQYNPLFRLATTIIRILANPQEGDNIPDREKYENQAIACCNIIQHQGVQTMTILMPLENDRIRNNCIVSIHTILTAISTQKEPYEFAKKQMREGIS